MLRTIKHLKRKLRIQKEWKDIPCSGIGVILLKWSNTIKILVKLQKPKAIYIFNVIHIKIPMTLHRTRTNNPKIYMEQ